jgi:hypothetical protein
MPGAAEAWPLWVQVRPGTGLNESRSAGPLRGRPRVAFAAHELSMQAFGNSRQ